MKEYKRILIIRTDRIGDVVLSTPVIKALRDKFPSSFIAMMTSPSTQELAKGNPYLNEVIVYDKDKLHKSIFSSFKFALELRRKKFDLALILHSTNRVNIITCLAGVRERVGYGRRLGFLLTKNIPYCKHKGEKHEVQYNLDILRSIGIDIIEASLFMPRDKEAESWADDLLLSFQITKGYKLVVIHPSASCVSRMWPIERFAEVSSVLIENYDARVIIVAGINDTPLADKLASLIKYPVINLAGKTTLMQLASIFRRSTLLISNDSGPVHMAVACGLPVVVLFGRNQPGIGPVRWGPLGEKDIFLHKQAGCLKCLAHNCQKGFLCLKSINVSEVLAAVDRILKVC